MNKNQHIATLFIFLLLIFLILKQLAGQNVDLKEINSSEISVKQFELIEEKTTTNIIIINEYILYIHYQDVFWRFAIGEYKIIDDTSLNVNFLKKETINYIFVNNIFLGNHNKIEAYNIDYFSDWKILGNELHFVDDRGILKKLLLAKEDNWSSKEDYIPYIKVGKKK